MRDLLLLNFPLLLLACAQDENQAPELLPLDNQEFQVNQSGEIIIRATDEDRDELGYDFSIDPEPLTQTQGQTARPALTRISNNEALFTWTPGVADAGGESHRDYALTFTVTDEDGDSDGRTIQIRVINDGGAAHSTVLRFTEPAGAGMALDLSRAECVSDLRVKVKADQVRDEDVLLQLLPPIPQGAMLFPQGRAGKEKTFTWCPSQEQLDTSLSHMISFGAQRVGGDELVTKRFQIRFRRNAEAACPGEPPLIQHQAPSGFEGPLNYELEAEISDDVGFKSPPVLLFVVDPAEPPSEGVDISSWELVEFSAQSGREDLYQLSIPNLGLKPGERAQIFYLIVATDNDDPDGTRCDHSSESPFYNFWVEGGEATGATYGPCHPCVGDEQCGGPEDLCVDMGGSFFCTLSCAAGQACRAGEECILIQSLEGQERSQCLPVDLNCGQRCDDDPFDTGARNDDWQHATIIEAGRYAGLNICGADQDFFLFPVDAGQSINVSIHFDGAVGDLDLAMQLPGDFGDEGQPLFAYQSLNANNDVEALKEFCTPNGGDVLLWVGPYEHAQNGYELRVELGPGDCNRVCEDQLESQPNDFLEQATILEALPFLAEGFKICPGDVDLYRFPAQGGEILELIINFSHRDGDLDLALLSAEGQVIDTSDGFRDTEFVEVEVALDGEMLAQVYGGTPSVANSYELFITQSQALECHSTQQCAVGLYCAESGCQDAQCAGPQSCAAGHACIPPRAGQDSSAVGGICSSGCESDLECRQEQGYRCKRFEDYSHRCALAGLGALGERCSQYSECQGESICFPTPGGYCAPGGCANDLPCPEGSLCGQLFGHSACLKRCENDGDCRSAEGYRCLELEGARACLPQ